jgi:hypothetical protein
MSFANLVGVDLSDADLSGVKLNGANLNRANLSGADLRGADLSNVNLREANLGGANPRTRPCARCGSARRTPYRHQSRHGHHRQRCRHERRDHGQVLVTDASARYSGAGGVGSAWWWGGWGSNPRPKDYEASAASRSARLPVLLSSMVADGVRAPTTVDHSSHPTSHPDDNRLLVNLNFVMVQLSRTQSSPGLTHRRHRDHSAYQQRRILIVSWGLELRGDLRSEHATERTRAT